MRASVRVPVAWLLIYLTLSVTPIEAYRRKQFQNASNNTRVSYAEVHNFQKSGFTEADESKAPDCESLKASVEERVPIVGSAQAELAGIKAKIDNGDESLSTWDSAWSLASATNEVRKFFSDMEDARLRECPWFLEKQVDMSVLEEASAPMRNSQKERLEEIVKKYEQRKDEEPLEQLQRAASIEVIEVMFGQFGEESAVEKARPEPLKTEAYRSLFPARLRALMDEEDDYWNRASVRAEEMMLEQKQEAQMERVKAGVKAELCKQNPEAEGCAATTTTTTQWVDLAPQWTYSDVPASRGGSALEVRGVTSLNTADDGEFFGWAIFVFVTAVWYCIVLVLCVATLVILLAPLVGLIWCTIGYIGQYLAWKLGWVDDKPNFKDCMEPFTWPYRNPGPEFHDIPLGALVGCGYGFMLPFWMVGR